MEKKVIYLVLSVCLLTGMSGNVYGQEECSRPVPRGLTHPWDNQWTGGYPKNAWNGFVFQLDENYNPAGDNQRNFLTSGANSGVLPVSEPPIQAELRYAPIYRGFLVRDGDSFLPTSGVNFHTSFGDVLENAYATDDNTFQTGNTATDLDFTGCPTTLSHFGLLMRTRIVVPQTGIYRIRVGSDDGSHMRMYYGTPITGGFAPNTNNPVLDVTGNALVHDNWTKNPLDPGWDGLYSFIYEQNIRSYYAEFQQGEEIFVQLSYYEKLGGNRLSFEFELYLGPGEIELSSRFDNIESYCGVNPDIEEFSSKVPGVFESGVASLYQWQYSTAEEPDTWVDIPGATGEKYDIPRHSDDPWQGTRLYRRAAIDVVIQQDENEDEVVTEIRTYSNTVEIHLTVTAIPLEDGQTLDDYVSEYGNHKWIGHIFRERGLFDIDHYIGRITEEETFDRLFRDPGTFPGQSGQVDFTPELGCSFFPDQFSVRYLMEYDLLPGHTYTVRINADDGVRFGIRDTNGNVLGGNEWLINLWVNGNKVDQVTTFEVQEPASIRFVLEYYEATADQRISFSMVSIQPVEWGEVRGEACADQNCVSWETIQEKSTSHFVVERSYDGKEWAGVGEAVEAQGYSTERTFYTFSDDTFLSERAYYRIRQVDLDGTVDYYEIVRIDNAQFRKKLAPYPNPTVDRVRFYSPSEVKLVQVTSQDARVTLNVPFEEVDKNIYEVNFSQFPSNQYVVTVVTAQDKTSHKVLKR